MLSLLILIPLACLLLISFLPLKGKRVAFAVVMALSFFQIYAVFSPTIMSNRLLPGLASVFNFTLAVDSLSRIMLLCIGIVIFIALLAAGPFVKEEDKRFYFSGLMILELMGLNGVVMVRDIFSMYVFWEVAAAASFVLIALEKKRDPLEGAFKYMIFSSVATVFVLAAIAIILLISGSTSFTAIRVALLVTPHSNLIILAVGVFLAGLFMKAGVMPFHGYLPDAYASAPAPVSILLAGVVTKTLGVYTAMRIVIDIFGFSASLKSILLCIGLISAIFGALAAMGQKDLKRLLAYSSISQVGYIFLGFGCGTPLGIAAAIFHIFNHTVFKSLLFVNAAAVEDRLGTLDMGRMSGLASRMPITGTTSVLASLSLSGVPPLAGFWSKLFIVLALWQSGLYGVAVTAVLASLLTLAYMLLLQRRVFFGTPEKDLAGVVEAGFNLALPAVILAILIVGVGLLFPYIVHTVIFPVVSF